MIALLKNLLPWHARKTLGFALNSYRRRRPPFSGVYSSYGEVPKTVGYNDSTWAETSRLAAAKAKDGIGQRIPETVPSKWLLPVLIAALGQRPIKVLDFGGASGLDYGNLSTLLGGLPANVSYHIIDVAGACEAGKQVWTDSPLVSFATSLPDAGTPFDIVYAYSAVHCHPDPTGLLKILASYNATSILLCKHPVHDREAFVRMQVNMGEGLELAQWVLNLREIETTLADFGYVLSFRCVGEDTYNVDNFDGAHKVGSSANLLFSRHSPNDPATS